MATTKNYAQGVFISKRQTQYGEVLDISARPKDFITWLQSLPVNDKGYIRMSAASQKNDVNKLSVWENDYVGKQQVTSGDTENELPF